MDSSQTDVKIMQENVSRTVDFTWKNLLCQRILTVGLFTVYLVNKNQFRLNLYFDIESFRFGSQKLQQTPLFVLLISRKLSCSHCNRSSWLVFDNNAACYLIRTSKLFIHYLPGHQNTRQVSRVQFGYSPTWEMPPAVYVISAMKRYLLTILARPLAYGTVRPRAVTVHVLVKLNITIFHITAC